MGIKRILIQALALVWVGICFARADWDEDATLQSFHLNYYSVLFGPGIKSPGAYQTNVEGAPDPDRPVNLRNFLSLGYNLTDDVVLSGTGYWIWQPSLKGQFQMLDPFMTLSHQGLIKNSPFHLYADARVHMAMSPVSREMDLLFGLQSFQALTYEIGGTPLLAGLYLSERSNIFGKQGYGNDFELYLAPNVTYVVSPSLALNLLYQVQKSHFFRQKGIHTDEAALQPGLFWDVVPSFTVNPYINIPTLPKVSWNTVSMGLFLSLSMF